MQNKITYLHPRPRGAKAVEALMRAWQQSHKAKDRRRLEAIQINRGEAVVN